MPTYVLDIETTGLDPVKHRIIEVAVLGVDDSLNVQNVLKDRDRVDTIIVVTDEQQNAGAPFLRRLAAYRQRVNPNVKTFVVNVAPYIHGHVAPPMDNLWYIYGWSERVLDFIALADRGFGSIVEAIRQGNI